MSSESASQRILTGKVAVITGGSRGIGWAIARQLAGADCHVVLAARNPERLEAAVAQIKQAGGEAIAQVCDVRDEQSVQTLFDVVKMRHGGMDILINNAGQASPLKPIQEMSYKNWREVLGVNLDGMFLCTHYALPMLRNHGSIVNNLSVASRQVFSGMAAYAASKHGALGFTDTLREELKERGIRVLALLPGATDTEIWQQFWPDAPRNRMIQAETVAAAVLHALTLPPEAAITELCIGPTAGTL